MGQSSLVRAVEDVLRQGRDLLSTVDTDTFTWKDQQGCGASIGMHYRHVLEHFQCLLEGLATGEINYDHRLRSTELEESVAAAMLATDGLIDRFGALSGETLRGECSVSYSVRTTEDAEEEVRSTLAREVMFCVGHATHHYALLKPLCAKLGVRLPYDFGFAPSTLKHMQSRETR